MRTTGDRALARDLADAVWIDLSAPVSNEYPSYPYSMQFRHTVWTRFSGVWPYYTRWWAIDEHTGTHFDAPAHFVPPPDSGYEFADSAGTVTSEQVALEQLRGPAVGAYFVFLPMRVEGGSGGPGRAVAIMGGGGG
ncbi:MAG: cyclase family protein [Solirubrobacterales bacterium]|nr:cyclase family protein [Solirubrobacterales bacterium]